MTPQSCAQLCIASACKAKRVQNHLKLQGVEGKIFFNTATFTPRNPLPRRFVTTLLEEETSAGARGRLGIPWMRPSFPRKQPWPRQASYHPSSRTGSVEIKAFVGKMKVFVTGECGEVWWRIQDDAGEDHAGILMELRTDADLKPLVWMR